MYSFDYSNANEVNDSKFTGSAKEGEGVNSITLDVKELGITAETGEFTVGFAVLPVTLTNGFTVKVVTTEGHIYTKSFGNNNTSKPLAFQRAHITSFGVNFNGVEPEEAVYLKAYKQQYGVPAGGFDNGKKYIIAAHTTDNTYTLNNENHTCNASNLEESGFTVVTEGDDHPYLLHSSVETSLKYAWNLTGSNNTYTITYNGYGWVCPEFLLGEQPLQLSQSYATNWTFSFNQRGFNVYSASNNKYVALNVKESLWQAQLSDTSLIDIYEDEDGYYWHHATVKEEPYVEYTKLSQNYKNGSTYYAALTIGKKYIIVTTDGYIFSNNSFALVNFEDAGFYRKDDNTLCGTQVNNYLYLIENAGSSIYFRFSSVSGFGYIGFDYSNSLQFLSDQYSARIWSVQPSTWYPEFKMKGSGDNYIGVDSNKKEFIKVASESSAVMVTFYEQTDTSAPAK